MVFSNNKNGKPDIAALMGKPKKELKLSPDLQKGTEGHKAKKSKLNKALSEANKLVKKRKIIEATHVLLDAHRMYPQSHEPLFELGMITMDQMDLLAAKKWFKACLERSPFNVEATMNLALTYARLGEFEQGESYALKGLDIERSAKHLVITSNVYRIHGKKEESKQYVIEALEKAPEYLPALAVFSEIVKFTPDSAELKSLKKISASQKKLSEQDRIFLNFALGKAHFDIKDYKEGFRYYRRGNDLKKKRMDRSRGMVEHVRREIDAVLEVFSRENLEAARAHTDKSSQSDQPIFVVGMPRSGTTLTEQIIASHEDVESAGEINDFVKSITAEGQQERTFEEMVRRTLDPENFVKTGHAYLERMKVKFPDAKYITDKLPFNYLWMGLITLALPNAKIVLCMRNPMDCGLSIYRQDFRSSTFWYNDLRSIGQIYNEFYRVVSHWQEIMPDRFFVMDYDKLVVDQETEVRKLVDYLGFEWSEDFLQFYKKKSTVMTASINQVRNKINTGSLQMWKNLEEELEPLYKEVAPLMKDKL